MAAPIGRELSAQNLSAHSERSHPISVLISVLISHIISHLISSLISSHLSSHLISHLMSHIISHLILILCHCGWQIKDRVVMSSALHALLLR